MGITGIKATRIIEIRQAHGHDALPEIKATRIIEIRQAHGHDALPE